MNQTYTVGARDALGKVSVFQACAEDREAAAQMVREHLFGLNPQQLVPCALVLLPESKA